MFATSIVAVTTVTTLASMAGIVARAMVVMMASNTRHDDCKIGYVLL